MKWIVSSSESGISLVKFIKAKLGPDVSVRKIRRLIETNSCRINNRVERFATTPVASRSEVALDLEDSEQIIFEPGRILYEDNDLLAYDKPAGALFWKYRGVQDEPVHCSLQ